MSNQKRLSVSCFFLTTAIVSGAVLSSPSAHATPKQDPYNTLTLQWENDAVSTQSGTSDRYYTNGLRIGWTSPTDSLPTPIADVNTFLLGKGMQRIHWGLQQMMFTPSDTRAFDKLPFDRPYAGVLLTTVNLISDTDNTRSVFGIQAGLMGPGALGRQVQNGFHSIIGDNKNNGWHNQLKNMPVFQVQMGRTWRYKFAQLGHVDFDVLPSANGAAGNYKTFAQLGGIVRFGQGLDSDFGPSRIGSGNDGTDAYVGTRFVNWYVFGGVDGQAVAYNSTLQGDPTHSHQQHVSKKWDVGEIVAGAAVIVKGYKIAYTQTWQTQEFNGQRSGLFNYGSVSVSFKF
ncbi:lipid A deacylase LpxR family protein [Commensalibacter nepenthis]|uniref:Lipid A deacylase LpxR family protein n=1 Tax=Commensalibacter nepenthis TaxID=3043872 RepID=A0ABT6Q4R7_9PROT|nr:lipid A deacylase LpxR family protein [Commensalibacter sp. TBRC 10068]MDI2111893.1 lipid A deacylase LpxR family protein [Commensalibacter sp. TBRC 10068]